MQRALEPDGMRITPEDQTDIDRVLDLVFPLARGFKGWTRKEAASEETTVVLANGTKKDAPSNQQVARAS